MRICDLCEGTKYVRRIEGEPNKFDGEFCSDCVPYKKKEEKIKITAKEMAWEMKKTETMIPKQFVTPGDFQRKTERRLELAWIVLQAIADGNQFAKELAQAIVSPNSVLGEKP
jgi:hypothetical protein